MRLNSLLSIISLSIVSSCAVWEKSGSNIYNTNSGNVGIGTTSPKSTLMVVDTNTNPSPTEVNAIFASTSAPTYGRAISGVASNKDGQDNFGGHFSAAGDNATGVLGITTDENKTGTGGVFHAAGKQGKGVHGLAFNASDDASNYGGWFEARGRQGIGVYAKGGEQGQAAQLDGKVRIAINEIGQALVVKGKTASGENLSTELFGGLRVHGGAAFYPDPYYALMAYSKPGYSAGYFSGDVEVLGDIQVTGYIHKGGGGFKIDHPTDPDNRYLYHAFVESPDMMNVYNGNVRLDKNGEAIVKLPDYFETLNKDFRYQLTSIGGPAPNLHIAQKISNNTFKISGGKSKLDVSWQVTGVRNDAYAKAHKITTEVKKEPENRGKYLHPQEWKKSEKFLIKPKAVNQP